MDSNEKLGLIERVNHASEDQAKRTLRSMILNCTVGQPTIARAIRDAIERHTPTPMIVYQQPESEDDDGGVLTSSNLKSNRKKDQDRDNQDGDDVPPTTSKKHRSTRRGDINPDPLVGQLILKKTKRNLSGKRKRSSGHDEEQSSPDSSKKSKHASKPRAETEQRACDNSMSRSSKQNKPTVIDLVTSSDDETSDTEQSENESLDDKSSHNAGSDDDSSDGSSDDSSSDQNSSDDEGSHNEQQVHALSEVAGTSQDGSSKKTTQASASSDNDGHCAAHSITISMAKTPIQTDSIKTSPLDLSKKRKAPEHSTEEVHNEQATKSTIVAHLNKKPKQNHMQESQRSSDDRQCRKCGILFPSVAQLLKHRNYCKGFAATLGSHLRSEPPSDIHSRQIKHVQKASHPSADSLPDDPRNTLELSSRPSQRAPGDRGLSVPPPNFVHEPNSLPRGPKSPPVALARRASDVNPLPPGLVHRPVSLRSSDGPPHHQSRRSEPKSLTKRLLREVREKAAYQCKDCKKRFWDFENSDRACRCHPGQYRSLALTESQLKLYFKDDNTPPQNLMAWTCCRRQHRTAPPCKKGRHVQREQA